jgi:4-hydroxybenzoate polyprenyltransferase/phosphoserine phosphatase
LKLNDKIEHIFVDLDGTLVRTDLFFEAILRLVKKNPINILRVAFWLLKGKAFAKHRVADLIEIEAAGLPYESSLVDYLKGQKKAGKQLILATASHRLYAEKIVAYLGLFDHVLATDAGNNLKGPKKLAAIQEYVGDAPFAYAGDSSADRPIWEQAAANILVNAPRHDLNYARRTAKDELVIVTTSSKLKAFVEEMRPHQYAKNILIFVPLLTSHAYADISNVMTALLAFVSFSLCASGAYFLNDLLDQDADRRHPTKCNRPLASGALPIPVGVLGAIGLPVIAFSLSIILLPNVFTWVLAVYFVITNAYSFYLKSLSTADVMTLALLYTLRVAAGAAAIGVVVSTWLMGFSIFVFVSLAFLKRYIEVAALPEESENVQGRGYSASDADALFSLGIANITASVLVLALFVSSAEIVALYRTPELLWGLCFLQLYWGNRIWIGARRGKIDDDPVVFAVKDRVSQMVGVAFLAIVVAAKLIDFKGL